MLFPPRCPRAAARRRHRVTTSPAQAETTLERAKAQGFIRVGFANEAPFGYATPDGKLTGEAPEVAKAVLAKMGIAQVDGVLTEFGSLIPGLKAGRFDIIAAGMFINPKRCDEIAFSEPSYGIGQAMLVKKGNPKGIKDFSTFARTTATSSLPSWPAPSRSATPRTPACRRSSSSFCPINRACVAAVQSDRADGAALTALSIADMAKKGEGVESTTPFGEVAGKSVKGHGGFGFRKEDTDLYEAFNAELKTFLGTPEHLALVTPIGFGKDYLPNKTMEQLCKGE